MNKDNERDYAVTTTRYNACTRLWDGSGSRAIRVLMHYNVVLHLIWRTCVVLEEHTEPGSLGCSCHAVIAQSVFNRSSTVRSVANS